MARYDDKAAAVAQVYAEAMLSLGEERGEADALGEELAELATLAEREPAFQDFLSNPVIDADDRAASLERMFRGRLSDLAVDSLQVLNRKGRIGLLPLVAAIYRRLHDEKHRRIEVQVTSAVALSPDQRSRLEETVAARLGKKPVLVERVDPALIGGMVLKIGDRKLDASVTSRLHTLGRALLNRASREIHSGVHVAE